MGKLFLIVLFLSSFTALCQKDTTYVRVGNKGLIDNKYEKIVGKKWIDWKDGTTPGKYYIVEYDYGEPPPNYHEILENYFGCRTTDTIRGWIISYKLVFKIDGDCPIIVYDITQKCINKINSLLPLYFERLSVSYPGCGGKDDDFSIRIWTTPEEMERRIAEINKTP